MLLLIISAAIVILVVYSLFVPKQVQTEQQTDVVTKPPCASCTPPAKTLKTLEQKGCVGGMCSKNFGCGPK